jgi:hypothetical protein
MWSSLGRCLPQDTANSRHCDRHIDTLRMLECHGESAVIAFVLIERILHGSGPDPYEVHF